MSEKDESRLIKARAEFQALNEQKHTAIEASWKEAGHMGRCGQSCPCCRFNIEGPGGFGVCHACQESYDEIVSKYGLAEKAEPE